MEAVLGYVSKQAMNYAIRSGFILTTSFVINQGNKLLTNAPKSGVRDELGTLQLRLQHKIRIISPAIDMIELIAARGNTSLESAILLTKDLRNEIYSIGQRLAQTNLLFQKAQSPTTGRRTTEENELQLNLIVTDLKKLLARIEDAVPLISLAITTSGVTLSASLPQTVSPSRLLQASTLLVAGDSRYSVTSHQAVQIGPAFNLTVYMLFAGHNRPQTEEEMRETMWKEVIRKARVKLRRVPLDMVTHTGSGSDSGPSKEIGPDHTDLRADARGDEYAYQLMLIEDLDDGLMHDHEEDQPQPGPFDDVGLAGIREIIPIHEISKIFYADTSKVLNIGMDVEGNHPVLLLKRDVNAVPPRRMTERVDPDASFTTNGTSAEDEGHAAAEHKHEAPDPWRFPPSLDPEWMAFEVYADPADDDDSISDTEDDSRLKPSPSLDQSLAKLNLSSQSSLPAQAEQTSNGQLTTSPSLPWANQIPTSLSLLELLLRLTSLQQFQQASHLNITDELLNFFLEESASTGAGGDERQRQMTRMDARRRVGWDPYDESPMKKRGEEYQYNNPRQQEGRSYYGSSPGDSLRDRMSPRVYESVRAGAGWSSPASVGLVNGSRGDGQSRPSIPDKSQVEDPPSPSPNVAATEKTRSNWLRRQDGERKGSPLRPSTGMTDEGLGTSPATSLDASGRGQIGDQGRVV